MRHRLNIKEGISKMAVDFISESTDMDRFVNLPPQ